MTATQSERWAGCWVCYQQTEKVMQVFILMQVRQNHPEIVSVHQTQAGAEEAKADYYDLSFQEYAEQLRKQYSEWRGTLKPIKPIVLFPVEGQNISDHDWDEYLEYLDSDAYEVDQKALEDYRYAKYEWQRNESLFSHGLDALLDRFSESLKDDLFIIKEEVMP